MNPTLIPLYNTDGTAQKPLGFPMCQNRLAPVVWSYAFEQLHPSRIIEIGSLNGGFTTALAFMTYKSSCQIYSFDLCEAPNRDWKLLADFLNIAFVKGDVFTMVSTISDMIKRPLTTVLMCDGGNKPKEFNTFAPFLKPGDVIAAHDYNCGEKYWPWSETKKEDIQATVEKERLEPFMQDYFDTCGWLVYRKPL